MVTKRFLLVACAVALALAALPAVTQAQGPLYDKVIVNMPYTVTVGDHVMQPGPYVIRQTESPGGANRVLQFFSDSGMQFETSALTIPTLDIDTPNDTKVVLHHFGQDYYMDKIWIQGKNYGYEFPLPESVKARQHERLAPMTVAATYQAEAPQEVARAAPPPPPEEPAPAPAPREEPAPAPAPVAAAPAPEPAPEPAAEPAPVSMPATASGWLLMVLSGGALSCLGLALRRK